MLLMLIIAAFDHLDIGYQSTLARNEIKKKERKLNLINYWIRVDGKEKMKSEIELKSSKVVK